MNNEIQMIPIERIKIINPRFRDKKKFDLIVQNIRNLGLKKPIKVSSRNSPPNGEATYELVCGQGRIEACQALGYTEIPAIVVDSSKEESLLMSLVENMARLPAKPLELIREIERLKNRGHKNSAIAGKLDISEAMVGGLLTLNKNGEERLIDAAIKGLIPLGVAIEIAKADGAEAQKELLTAYENKELNQVSIRTVKRLIEQRRFLGKSCTRRAKGEHSTRARTSTEGLVAAYRKESQRQRLMVKKAKICESRLTFALAAFKKLFTDDNFLTLLRAEALLNAPKFLADSIDEVRRARP